MEETPLAPSEGFSELRSEVVERGNAEDAPPKKKRGRPSNAERLARGETIGSTPRKVAEPRPDFLPVETVVAMVALPFDLIAKRKGEHWKLSEEESKQIGTLTAKVLTKNVPEWLDKWGDEIALATVLGMAIVGRYMIDLNERAKEEKRTIEAEATRAPLYPLSPDIVIAAD